MSENRVTYVGHATVLLELGGLRILTDPVLRSRVAHLRRQVPAPDAGVTENLDAVLISHLHFDHADVPSLRRLERTTPVLAPPGAGAFLERVGFEAVTELGAGHSSAIGGLQIAAVEAQHGHGRSPLTRGSEAIGFHLAGGSAVYFAGDTDLFGGMRELAGGLDLALLPIWGWGPRIGAGHLNPERAAQAAAMLSPRLAVPIHWGTFFPLGPSRRRHETLTGPPREFARRCADLAPRVEARILTPGERTPIPGKPP